jgi:RNA polymerase sigma-70 factor (ECF subfamily)
MTDVVWVRMPPIPLEYQGRDLAKRFFATVAFRRGRRYRLVSTRANGQPAFGAYVRDTVTAVAHANGLWVITVAGEKMSALPDSTLPPSAVWTAPCAQRMSAVRPHQ